MLTAADLAGMRATLDTSLPDACVISRSVLVEDGSGGWTDTPVSINTPCRVSPLATAGRDFESYDAGRIVSSVPWVITFPFGMVVQPDDRITHMGNSYEVIAAGSERTYEIDVRIIARRMDAPSVVVP